MPKPEIPTWLVGSAEEMGLFSLLVPAPNEAYTQLFWPYNTDVYDKDLQDRLAERKASIAAAKRLGAQA